MRLMAAAGVILFATLAGCGDRSERATDDADAATTNVQAQIAALPEGQRNGVFIRAIRDAREACQHVERSERSGEHQGRPVWTAHCEGGGEYTIVIGDDGTAAVLNASEATLADGNKTAVEGQ